MAVSFVGNQEQDIHIQPVGISYLHREKFRSSVLVNYGPAIIVDTKTVSSKSWFFGCCFFSSKSSNCHYFDEY